MLVTTAAGPLLSTVGALMLLLLLLVEAVVHIREVAVLFSVFPVALDAEVDGEVVVADGTEVVDG